MRDQDETTFRDGIVEFKCQAPNGVTCVVSYPYDALIKEMCDVATHKLDPEMGMRIWLMLLIEQQRFFEGFQQQLASRVEEAMIDGMEEMALIFTEFLYKKLSRSAVGPYYTPDVALSPGEKQHMEEYFNAKERGFKGRQKQTKKLLGLGAGRPRSLDLWDVLMWGVQCVHNGIKVGDLNQEEFADKVGINVSHLKKILRSKQLSWFAVKRNILELARIYPSSLRLVTQHKNTNGLQAI